ncbi:MAG TPA: hypothetical protein ENJ24_01910 [Gammaproteobacteria bacterium]|nr:hypothetical protein [Gammaproteobacteria bacterium]
MRSIYLFLLSLVLIPVTTAQGDVLTLPTVTPVKHGTKLPVRGMSMQQVIKQFGQPLTKLPTIGDPPISRWNYKHYSVYFEGPYVIHSVHDKR